MTTKAQNSRQAIDACTVKLQNWNPFMNFPSLTKTLINLENFSLLPLDFSKLSLSGDDKTTPTNKKKDPLRRIIRSKRRRWIRRLGSGSSRFMIRKRSGSVGNCCSIGGFDSEGSDSGYRSDPGYCADSEFEDDGGDDDDDDDEDLSFGATISRIIVFQCRTDNKALQRMPSWGKRSSQMQMSKAQ
ncbi:hypothetical protein RJ641_004269 [Dillenia turbinata]|uniref:Uncharacterized protein n=1 Tax=Dillenia turbinata TaxID=194707 RepID=A0AAN8V9N3_9MAGN